MSSSRKLSNSKIRHRSNLLGVSLTSCRHFFLLSVQHTFSCQTLEISGNKYVHPVYTIKLLYRISSMHLRERENNKCISEESQMQIKDIGLYKLLSWWNIIQSAKKDESGDLILKVILGSTVAVSVQPNCLKSESNRVTDLFSRTHRTGSILLTGQCGAFFLLFCLFDIKHSFFLHPIFICCLNC